MELFNFEPDLEEVQYESYFLNERTDLQTGLVHVRNLEPKPMKTWTLTFQELTEKAAQVLAFYEARKGDLETFMFVSPVDGLTYCVKFSGKFSGRMRVRGIHYFSLKLERDLAVEPEV